MKKYRLIRTYPNSPELGIILQEKGVNSWHSLDNKRIWNGLSPNKYPEI